MRKSPFSLLTLFFCVNMMYSQVGVGTTDPTSEFEIATTNTGIPALELNPQSNPIGSVTGQLAVIGDKLFMYDAIRSKWLSVESTAVQFGRNGNSDDNNLLFGGNQNGGNSGALMPFNGTIVYISATAASGDDTDINVRARDINNNNSIDETFTLSGLRFINPNANLDFNAGDFITARARDNDTEANDLTVIFWVKWRN